MKTFRKICLSFALSILTFGQSQADPSMECAVGNDTQVQIGNCVGAVEATVDQTLEFAFGIAMNAAKELDSVTGRDVGLKALAASQAAWTAFRESQCEYVGATYGGGSGTGIAISSCRVDLGRQRIEALIDLSN